MNKLSKSMTLTQFENGYWYSTELKNFANEIGIPSAAKLRKDELELAIKCFLRTGKIELPTKRNLKKTGMKDLEKGLSLNLPVVHYTSNNRDQKLYCPGGQENRSCLKREVRSSL